MSQHAQDRVLAFIRGRYPEARITEAEDIFQLGFINSLFAMELVMFVEKEFAVTIPNEELHIDNFRTAKSMAELVGRLGADTTATADATADAAVTVEV